MGLLAPTRKEAGCINYDLHLSPRTRPKFSFTKTDRQSGASTPPADTAYQNLFAPLFCEMNCASRFQKIKIWERSSRKASCLSPFPFFSLANRHAAGPAFFQGRFEPVENVAAGRWQNYLVLQMVRLSKGVLVSFVSSPCSNLNLLQNEIR